MKCFNRLFSDRGYAIGWGIISAFIVAIAVLAVAVGAVIAMIDATSDDYANNVITVEGRGEVNSSPDVAQFSFSIQERADTTEAAQEVVNTKMEAIQKYLEDQDIDEKDIKTTGYNVYPRYEWIRPTCLFDQECPPGKNELVGYEASQSVSVKVRDIDEAGAVLSGIGALGVSNVSGLQFVIDDDAALKEEAQKLAIQDAKERAKRLASELGVSLDDVVSFYEHGGGYPEPYYEERAMMMDAVAESAPANAVLPTGENTIVSTVSITYEIK